MAEIVNLRMARKAQKRREADGQAAANRARFGQTKGERASAGKEAERLTRTIEGARREREED